MHSFLLSSLSTAVSVPWTALASAAQSVCLGTLKKLCVGQLTVVLLNGDTHVFGKKGSDLAATLTIRNNGFWVRLLFLGTMGMGEGYMLGDIDVDRIDLLLKILIFNRHLIEDSAQPYPASLNRFFNTTLAPHIPNSIYNSRSNISLHYDLGNDMFASFLDPTMTYSCPIWASKEGGTDPLLKEDTLEKAQIRKIHHLLDLACIREGDHVLEMGTGWGALAIEAVRRHRCHVTTITLSSEQQILAQDRIRDANLSDHITVLLCDYRKLDEAKYSFDRIISVEMIEAVGPEFLSTYFEKCDKLLKPQGVMAIQVITMPEARYKTYSESIDFIRKHIFPGGHCPSLTALTEAVHQGTSGRLMVDTVENIGPHYAKALRLWRERFIAHFDQVVARCKGNTGMYDQVFLRKWEYYFAYCEAGFASRTLGTLQIRLTRPANMDLIQGIPF
ncbi:hypothetical protein BASA50_005926 [Batrachochytrium salamandrivorans]|uniref:Cyclopropane-fatty-acyl-phospholipid synthase n=1 Tax=Batrachochytrium salamandrivorans TaxID=1357716 RepID=A0ABQ8FBA5_9FUNG|nr:hypothetical protein BASA60_008790 [Batrachochytrium salamandrivorans]KAH6572195.1 hypothetical protein BASA62_003519 [Batrachochytrium salamandrivorans]KAH6595283.1 hypothetical protein BASA50_005926 [Batrachochytrium salamandrivorans]KAH9264620.1 hypothetical protein BASA83_011870 [Batrachochytrium salamandrivorans]